MLSRHTFLAWNVLWFPLWVQLHTQMHISHDWFQVPPFPLKVHLLWLFHAYSTHTPLTCVTVVRKHNHEIWGSYDTEHQIMAASIVTMFSFIKLCASIFRLEEWRWSQQVIPKLWYLPPNYMQSHPRRSWSKQMWHFIKWTVTTYGTLWIILDVVRQTKQTKL